MAFKFWRRIATDISRNVPVDEFQLIYETGGKIGLILGSLKYGVWYL